MSRVTRKIRHNERVIHALSNGIYVSDIQNGLAIPLQPGTPN